MNAPTRLNETYMNDMFSFLTDRKLEQIQLVSKKTYAVIGHMEQRCTLESLTIELNGGKRRRQLDLRRMDMMKLDWKACGEMGCKDILMMVDEMECNQPLFPAAPIDARIAIKGHLVVVGEWEHMYPFSLLDANSPTPSKAEVKSLLHLMLHLDGCAFRTLTVPPLMQGTIDVAKDEKSFSIRSPYVKAFEEAEGCFKLYHRLH